jgi:hypothetical protein
MVAVGVKKILNDFRDHAGEVPGVVIEEIGKAVIDKGSVHFLDDGALDEVARIEEFRVFGVQLSCFVDLSGCSSGKVWEYREYRSNEWNSGGDALISKGAADESKVSLAAATEGGTGGFAVFFAFFFEFWKTFLGRIAADFCQRGVLEVARPVVYLGVRHCPY